jgi:hypothetical protein
MGIISRYYICFSLLDLPNFFALVPLFPNLNLLRLPAAAAAAACLRRRENSKSS